MSERRKELRVPAEIEIILSAVKADGTPFNQTVSARNLSGSGALLTGLDHKLRCGDLIRIHYGDNQARFRVVWMANSAHGPFTAAVHKLPNDSCPWAAALTESIAAISNR